MTPIVRNADQKTISEISAEVHSWICFCLRCLVLYGPFYFMISFILDNTIFRLSLLLLPKVKELAEKARAGKLKPNEFQGGTFR